MEQIAKRCDSETHGSEVHPQIQQEMYLTAVDDINSPNSVDFAILEPSRLVWGLLDPSRATIAILKNAPSFAG